MSARGSMKAADAYADCRCFVSVTGYSGFALRKDGDLLDLFVSPRENEAVVYDLMALAIQQGAIQLATYGHPLLARFFEQFGFEVVSLLDPKGAPPNWLPESFRAGNAPISRCPPFLFMALRDPRFPQATSPEKRGGPSSGVPWESCARCEKAIADEVVSLEVFDGYECPHCGFIGVVGTLTLGAAEPASPPNPELSSPNPREQPCPCGSGKAFSECHGSE